MSMDGGQKEKKPYRNLKLTPSRIREIREGHIAGARADSLTTVVGDLRVVADGAIANGDMVRVLGVFARNQSGVFRVQ